MYKRIDGASAVSIILLRTPNPKLEQERTEQKLERFEVGRRYSSGTEEFGVIIEDETGGEVLESACAGEGHCVIINTLVFITVPACSES